MKKNMKQLIVLMLVAILTAQCNISESPKSTATQPPNIILIVTDDQGYADLSAYEHVSAHCKTPHMDRIAKNGVLFDNCYVSGPVCSPSRAAIYTGKYQERWDHNMSWAPGLPVNVPTIAEILNKNGYVTGKVGKSDFGKNYHNPEARDFPNNHGYDSFIGFSAHAHDFWLLDEDIEKATPDPYGESASLGRIFRNKVKVGFKDTYSTNLYTDEALMFIESNKDKPFFLDLSYNAVHELIHQVPEEYRKKWDAPKIPNYDPSMGTYNDYYYKYTKVGDITDEGKRKLYLANLNCLDDNIGRLLNVLEKLEILDNTMILLISDNGGEPLTGANNLPLTGSKYTMHEGGIRVPFIISWPEGLPKNKLYQHRVSAMDIMPTCLEAAGVNMHGDYEFDGCSLIEPIAINMPSDKAKDPLCFQFGKQWAIIDDGWKLVYAEDYKPHWRPITSQIRLGVNSGQVGLYNLNTDIEEQNNLIDLLPRKGEELQMKFDMWLNDMKQDHKNYQFKQVEKMDLKGHKN
ncbi:sulfatase-like hydrolase/transferase [Carboxylicivirga sp. A043]|uniref:sulfatase family protein n=1 Tax=Carboxylicivirga litoralis TaxID=2816963 RepID=UPI0021CB8457|nr:sulfatase-like hydrolase/transferase [Carboxylicivirga sp. A043]MCU4157758.1 sulfatase-like hydrolase/transferase [Carboxylicivirga sp. A043]